MLSYSPFIELLVFFCLGVRSCSASGDSSGDGGGGSVGIRAIGCNPTPTASNSTNGLRGYLLAQ
jgi:hypothetical protein